MAITVKSRDVVNYNAIGTGGKPKQDQYLDFVDDAGNTVASLAVPASGATPSFEIDAANAVTDDTVAIKSASVTLTDAQIKALPTTAVTILAAPTSPTRIYHLLGAYVVCDSSAGAYTNLGSTSGGITTLQVFGGGSTGLDGPKMSDINAWLGGNRRFGAFTQRMRVFDADDIDVTTTLMEAGQTYSAMATPLTSEPFGNAVRINALNYTTEFGSNLGAFTGGHADNSLKVTVHYLVFDV
jgi:hypothetical protein